MDSRNQDNGGRECGNAGDFFPKEAPSVLGELLSRRNTEPVGFWAATECAVQVLRYSSDLARLMAKFEGNPKTRAIVSPGEKERAWRLVAELEGLSRAVLCAARETEAEREAA